MAIKLPSSDPAAQARAKDQFFSLHRQGFVRVAACTPLMSVGDPKSNTAETLSLMREGSARNVDLMLFPELGISAYAIDDLLLQDALLDGVEAGLAEIVQASRTRSLRRSPREK